MKYSNFNIKYFIIFKLLLCLYIVVSPYIEHDNILIVMNYDSIKILFILFILYFIKIDYIISLLLSICLIIMIFLQNKDSIKIIKTQIIKKNIDTKLNKISEDDKDGDDKDGDDKDGDDKDGDDEDGDDEDGDDKDGDEQNINNAIMTESYITNNDKNLEKIQTNIFNKKNNLIYFSGFYTNSLITSQGELELV